MRKVIYDESVKFNLDEEFHQIVPICKKYFETGGSHTEVNFERERNAIHVYCKILNIGSACSTCEYKNERNVVQIDNVHIPENVFYDWVDGVSKPMCTQILVNERFAGFYCKKFNSLYLTDWTHSSRIAPIAKKLLKTVIQKLEIPVLENYDYRTSWRNFNVMIGGDPEFEHLRTRDSYSPIKASIRATRFIGTDGSGDQIELRPPPAHTPEEFVDNIGELIHQLTEMNVLVSVKGDVYPLGAHIHFEIPQRLKDSRIIRKICTVLDDFLGKRLIDLSGSARGSYKVLTSYEIKSYGFEYRSLPSAILVNPKIARIVFKTAKNVVEYCIRNAVVDYNPTPTFRDYSRIAGLTEEEYDYLMSFPREYSMYKGEPINFNWASENSVHHLITFGDDWLGENMLFVKKLIRNMVTDRSINIHFYGLKRSRGNVVAGFEIDGYETIDHPRGFDEELVFGLPYHVRMNPLPEVEQELERMIRTVIETKVLEKDLVTT